MKRYLFTILLAAFSLISHAQGDCPKVKRSEFPKKDLPPAGFNKSSLKKTTSYSYYYGLGVKKDYKTARYLAFIEMSDDEGPFEGSSILLMLYANGYGVKRNLDLCIRLACGNVGGAPAEVDIRAEHLKAMKSGDSSGVFDICNDITSGYMDGFCQSIASERISYQQAARVESILRSWSKKDTIAYGVLRRAANDFFNVRVGNEVDLSGTSRAAFSLQESDALEDAFVKQTSLAGKCSFKNYTEADFTKADKELNAVYKKIMSSKTPDWGTITKEGIKDTQRAWLHYRDAWAVFSKIKCPVLSEYALKTIITKERIVQIKDFADAD